MLTVTVPSCVATPKNWTELPAIAYTDAPFLMAVFVTVIEMALPGAVTGTVPSGATQAITKERMYPFEVGIFAEDVAEVASK